MKIGYARVSTKGQTLQPQKIALRAAGVEKIIEEKRSGITQRPELDKLLNTLSPGDELVVTRLDRLGRSMTHLVTVVTDLQERGIHFQSLHEQIDTTSATGKLQLSLFAAFAQFERDLISERTKAGLQAAKQRGKTPGRPKAMTPDKINAAHTMRNQGHTYQQIANSLSVSKDTIKRHFKTHTNHNI